MVRSPMSSPTTSRKIRNHWTLVHTSQALPALPCCVARGAITRSTVLPLLLSLSSPTPPRKIRNHRTLVHTNQALSALSCCVARGAVTRTTGLPFLLSCSVVEYWPVCLYPRATKATLSKETWGIKTQWFWFRLWFWCSFNANSEENTHTHNQLQR